MKKYFLWLLFLGSASVVLFTGCASTEQKKDMNTSSTLEAQALARFSDIPLPTGFKLIPQSSYSFESSGVRVGVLKYQGKANPDQVLNFYREQMPMYNWRLLNVTEYIDRVLNFDRDNETCIITLSGRGSSVTITIFMGPKSQGPARKSKELVK
jgi:hypothetical protein